MIEDVKVIANFVERNGNAGQEVQ